MIADMLSNRLLSLVFPSFLLMEFILLWIPPSFFYPPICHCTFAPLKMYYTVTVFQPYLKPRVWISVKTFILGPLTRMIASKTLWPIQVPFSSKGKRLRDAKVKWSTKPVEDLSNQPQQIIICARLFSYFEIYCWWAKLPRKLGRREGWVFYLNGRNQCQLFQVIKANA